ncbi:hypothetical protein BaRGS_00001557 [Batillaria attramentaria]|uniref:Hypervirulence associated protein TUDOR domain-containing protein n=1 Tax=Batillaria attramentaria TaxID=370345 RepID=A0ABD0M7X8_9CAEN
MTNAQYENDQVFIQTKTSTGDFTEVHLVQTTADRLNSTQYSRHADVPSTPDMQNKNGATSKHTHSNPRPNLHTCTSISGGEVGRTN